MDQWGMGERYLFYSDDLYLWQTIAVKQIICDFAVQHFTGPVD